MKKQSRRARTQSAPPPVRHQLEHVVPTVIHDPEAEMTALGRLTSHAIKDPGHYLRWPLTIITILALGFVVWKLATSGRSTAGDVWLKLESAKTSEDRVNLAKEYPNTPASTWALLQAAKDYYNLALSDLPQNRDVAMPTAKKALDLFDQVVTEAPHDSPQARAAAFGKARTLELRNDLPKAIEQYQLVVKEWPGTPEADEAKRFETALRDPEAEAFYKDFQAYSPTKMTLPPLGTESLPSSLLGPVNPSTTPTGTNAPFGPLAPMPNTGGSTSTSPPVGAGLPAEPLSKGLPEVRIEPKTSTVKAPAEAAPARSVVPAPISQDGAQQARTDSQGRARKAGSDSQGRTQQARTGSKDGAAKAGFHSEDGARKAGSDP